MRPSRPGVVLAGGGTAGHVFPGLELAARLAEAGHPKERIVFTGTEKGTGAEIIKSAGYRFVPLHVSGLSRSKPLSNFKVLTEFIAGIARSLRLVRREAPSLVVGLGGYSSLPVLIAAWILGTPRTILQEDATLGISNRIASWTCRKIAVAFPAPREMFGGRGVRVRPAVRSTISRLADVRDKRTARESLGVPADSEVVLFVGGSLGAGPINDAAFATAKRWADRQGLAIIHVCGKRFFEECEAKLGETQLAESGLAYRLIAFEPHFERLLEAATVAVTRGGATTVGELAASGTPAVVIPSSYVTANHQEPNARALELAGGCEVVLDSECERVPDVLDSLIGSPERLKEMSAAGPRACAADVDFADVVMEVGCLS
ncbi:MAG: hypothetical protein DCC49_02525 [Acidobacteria bacterium]|nr:MAG: hypothetical protein DCC49_02525 [Acidobacteriota bacterium]